MQVRASGGTSKIADTDLPRIHSQATLSVMTQSRRWMFGRIFGLDGRESYRELRLSRYADLTGQAGGAAPYGREYPRRKDRF
jgi:hypothetical protein